MPPADRLARHIAPLGVAASGASWKSCIAEYRKALAKYGCFIDEILRVIAFVGAEREPRNRSQVEKYAHNTSGRSS
jgi:hypothetical protein